MVIHRTYGNKMSLCNGIPEGHAAIASKVDADVTCRECLEIMKMWERNKQ